ncbi:uncharacterized protein PG998_014189 [Apiospora kogelbergensis]|uniref:uncharacterized protein n=1 Tax=Apiospora kogelbergensis TaxID=1337665 RepID=UPI003130B9C2
MAPLTNLPLVWTPTRTLPSALTHALHLRQATAAATVVTDIGNDSGHNNLSGGAIAGIIIGSIAGFLLILWIICSCTNLGKPDIWGSTFGAHDEPPVTSTYPVHPYPHDMHRSSSRHSHGHHRGHGHHNYSHSNGRSRKSTEVSNVTTIRPAYYGSSSRSRRRSPATLPPVPYYPQDLGV